MKHLLLCLSVAAVLGLNFGSDARAVPPNLAPSPAAASNATAPKAASPQSKPVDFNRDVIPILSNNCFKCHGPDSSERKARLRLDLSEVATKPAESGYIAIVPGKPDKSEVVERIFSSDDDERMPPPKSNKHLTDTQRQVLKQWIAEGAVYKRHWAYVVPEQPAVPLMGILPPSARAALGGQPTSPIDAFVLAKLKAQKLKPSAPADRVTLVRRLYFDLTGLPPSPEQVAEFVGDRDPGAYEKLVDRLLASQHYGERMAMYWLDLVRYGDSCGYHSDNPRDVYLYRDYVIAAFNADKPFDRFTVEQLAGDLLPDASRETRIASGYNRLLLTTEEGGAQAKEYTAKYAADRVRNLASVWLGSTMACCECHDHKFDPFKTRDFYSMEAFFADVKENAIARQDETPMPTPEQAEQLKRLDAELASARRTLDGETPALDAAQAAWEKALESATDDRKPLPPPSIPTKSHATQSAAAQKAPAQKPPAQKPPPAKRKGLPAKIEEILAKAPAKRSSAERQSLSAYYRTIAPELQTARAKIAELDRKKAELERDIPKTLTTTAVAPRTVRVLARGNWQDDSGEIVSPAVPQFLLPLEIKDRRPNRLDLARWLVDRRNPLVARVFVNRMWMLMFGQGIVKTSEDFGTQGAEPSHPKLLDWLATEFVVSGWDVKHLMKLIAMSATYRQTSFASPELQQIDPDNRWLARQGRFRLDAEFVRDDALAISGLLSPKIGGPSVKPYQPAGYWAYLNFPTRRWAPDHGENEYRRGLYTWWQRTFLHPSLRAFDAPTREACTAARARSNTPLQSLVLLNDPTYVEAARVFAAQIVREGGAKPAERIEWAFRRALSRPATADESRILADLYNKHHAEYIADTAAAKKLLGVGDAKAPAGVDPADLAAWTSVARVILNLHETITRS